MESPYETAARDELNRILPGLYDDLSQIERLPEAKAQEAVGLLVGRACKSQNSGNITIARRMLAWVPQPLLTKYLRSCVEQELDLGDEWEYRRLLELLIELHAPLLTNYVRIGQESTSPDIREAAIDMDPEHS